MGTHTHRRALRTFGRLLGMRACALLAAALTALGPAPALAQKLGNLPAASSIASTDVVPVSQGCTAPPPAAACTATNAATGAQLKTWAQSGLAASATTDTTNASNISAGTLAAARGGAGAITGALKANGSGVVSQAAASDLSNGVTGSGAVVLAASPTFTAGFTVASASPLSFGTSASICNPSSSIVEIGSSASCASGGFLEVSTTETGFIENRSNSGHIWVTGAAPTVTSGLGTSPTVGGNGTLAVVVTVSATGTPSATVVLAMPAGVAATGWDCPTLTDMTAHTMGPQTATSTTSASFLLPAPPANGDTVEAVCAAY